MSEDFFGGTKRNKAEQLKWPGFFLGRRVEMIEMAEGFEKVTRTEDERTVVVRARSGRNRFSPGFAA
jgi:hypothetical protein